MTGRFVALVTAAALASASPPDSRLRAMAAGAATSQVLTGVLADLTAAMLAVLLVWLAAAHAARTLRRYPGLLGQVADGAWRLLVPAVLRAGVVAAVGVQAVAAPAVALDDSTVTAVDVPVIARPQGGTSATVSTRPAQPEPVRVEPCDSLWRIAQRSLGEAATPAEVAALWPRWYERNRSTIGPDPDLLLVGMVLTPPTVAGSQQ